MRDSGVGGVGGVKPARVRAWFQEPKRRVMVEAVQGRAGHLLKSDWRREVGAKVRREERRRVSVRSGGSVKMKRTLGFMRHPR